MARTEWQQRLSRLGMSQKELGGLLGLDPNSISRQLRGRFGGGEVPQHVIAVILALEVMTEEQRVSWQAEVRKHVDGTGVDRAR